jgi:fumarate reductase flavoprotein subunit
MPATPFPVFDEMIEKLAKEWGAARIASTWDEIAEWMGAKPETLKNTVNQFNTSCDHGYDELFIKDRRYLEPLRTPPYYAIKMVPTILNTIGGTKINYCMEVVNNNHGVIPGLYAAGVDTSGWSHQPYNMRFPGNMLSYAINGRRMAGESAAEYVSA